MHLTSIQVLSHLHPGSKIRISPPCMLHLTFIQVPTKQHQGPNIFISPPSMLDLATIWVPRIAFPSRSIPPISRSPDVSHLHLGPVSLPSRSRYSRLTSIQVTSQLPFRSRQLHISSIQVPSHYQARLDNHVSSPTRSRYSCLTIQFTSHPHLHSAKCISVSSRSISSHPGPKVCVSPPWRPHLTPIHITRFASHLHPGSTSSASRSQDLHLTSISVMSPLLSVCKDCNSPASRSHLTPSRFLNLCLTSIQYMPHLHPGPDIRVTSSFRSHLVSIQVLIQVPRMASQLHPSPISAHPGHETFISPPSKYHFTSILVPGFTSHSHLFLCHVSPLYRSQDSRLTSIQVPSHFIHLLNFICDSPPSRLCLTSPPFRTWFKCIKVPICTHLLHWCCVSHPSRSWEEHLNSIQITSLTHLGLQMCISPPSRSRLTSVQFPILCLTYIQVASHLHSGPEVAS